MEVTVRIALILILKCLLGTRDIFLELKTNRGGCGQKMLNFPHCAWLTRNKSSFKAISSSVYFTKEFFIINSDH